MSTTLAFDIYGTLINVHGVTVELEQMLGSKAQAFSTIWRDKQLEYSFRRGLMQNYEPFSVCTRHALDYTCLFLGVDLSAGQRKKLLDGYRSLPPFDDVKRSLGTLKKRGVRLFAFSNGTREEVSRLLDDAGLLSFFISVISADDVKSFKPNPAVYNHFLRQSESTESSTWLISSNPFDVIGAVSVGWRAAWLQRSAATVFDPWKIDPTITIASLDEFSANWDG